MKTFKMSDKESSKFGPDNEILVTDYLKQKVPLLNKKQNTDNITLQTETSLEMTDEVKK